MVGGKENTDAASARWTTASRLTPVEPMRLVASDAAVDFIETHGGRLYIWMKKNRCCGGGFHTLGTATEAPPSITFRRLDHDSTNVALFVPETLSRMPDELHVELRRFPRRVEAYWNGCAWVV